MARWETDGSLRASKDGSAPIWLVEYLRLRTLHVQSQTAVTNALSAPASRAAGRPCPPLDRARSATLQARSSRPAISHWPRQRPASVCGSAARVALRLRSARRSSPAYAPLSPLADRRPKQELSGIAVAWRTPAAGLNWRAFHGAIRTEYTAMSWFRFQACSTATASEKEQARIRGHLFTALLAAVRAGQHRFDFDSVTPLTSTVCAFFVRHLGHLILSADFAPRVRSHSTTESALLRRAASRAVRFSHPGSQFNSASRARRYSAARSCPP